MFGFKLVDIYDQLQLLQLSQKRHGGCCKPPAPQKAPKTKQLNICVLLLIMFNSQKVKQLTHRHECLPNDVSVSDE